MFHPIKLFHDFKVLRANYVDVICAILGYCARYGDSSLLTVRDNLSVPYSRVKKSIAHVQMGPIGYPETSVRNGHYTLRNIPEERRFHLLRGKNMKLRGCVSVFLLPPHRPFVCSAIAHGQQ